MSVCEFRPTGIQVIVIDDGSARGAVSQVAGIFDRVEVLRTPGSHGFAAAANRGIAAATGEIIELLNDDTQVTPGWANAALRWFDDPTGGAGGPGVLPGPGRDGVPILGSAGGGFGRGGFGRKRGHGEPPSDRFRTPCEVFGASASSAFYRADVLRSVGGF